MHEVHEFGCKGLRVKECSPAFPAGARKYVQMILVGNFKL